MKRRASIIFFFFLLLILKSDQQLQRIIESFKNLRYLISLPDDYGKDTTVRWPIILFLHGSKEWGNDLSKVSENGPPKLIKEGRKFPFIIVSPQLKFGQFWDPDLLVILLKKIESMYRVDKDKLYLTGLSLGGYGTWYTALKYPGLFAAIAPVCGGGNPAGSWKIRHLPVWIFHGAKDHTVPLSRSADMASTLMQFNNVRFTIYPDADHDSWTETYNNEELYKWFLEQKRFRFTEKELNLPVENFNGKFSSGNDSLTIFQRDGKLILKPDKTAGVELPLHYGGESSLYFDENSPKEIRFNSDRNGKMSSFIFYNDTPKTYFRIGD